MKYQSSLSLFLSLALGFVVAAVGQTVPQTSTARPQELQRAPDEEDEVVRITTNLVQLDAVVTDGDGRHVTDLGPEDFEVLEDGRPQPITNFSFIKTDAAPSDPAAADAGRAAPSSKGVRAHPLPPARLRREQVRRTLALVVDDLRMSFLSLQDTRIALKRFVDEQLRPGDLVAIIRTSSGVGSLEQFTSDRRQLHAAVERLRWYPSQTNTTEAVASITNDTRALSFSDKAGAEGEGKEAQEEEQRRRDAEEEMRQGRERSARRDVVFTSGTLGSVNFILRGLRDAASDRTGAAGQFIEVPDFGKGSLALSGLIVNPRESAAAASEVVHSSGSSTRRFRTDSAFDYGYLIYNARLDKATGRPRLTTQARLFRDGRLIHQSTPQEFDAGRQTDMERLLAAGSLQVGADLAPGEYVLQVVVEDSLAGGKRGAASQWIDFQVVK